MMVCDTLPATTSIWYNHMLPEDSPGKLEDRNLITIYQKIDDAFGGHGNGVYQSLSMYEPVVLSILLNHHEIKKSGEFHQLGP
jgi:hypothetical protein